MTNQAVAQVILLMLCSSFLIPLLFSIKTVGRKVDFADVAANAIFLFFGEVLGILLLCLIKVALGV